MPSKGTWGTCSKNFNLLQKPNSPSTTEIYDTYSKFMASYSASKSVKYTKMHHPCMFSKDRTSNNLDTATAWKL